MNSSTDSIGPYDDDGVVVGSDGAVLLHLQGKECLKSDYLKERIEDLTRELESVQDGVKREVIERKLEAKQMELDSILGLHDDEL